MPPPKKIDLLPPQLMEYLRSELAQRGFAEIVEVTEALNFRLEEDGLELRIGKTAVGNFSKLLKDQREALDVARVLMADMDIEGEGKMHQAMLQMISIAAVNMMQSAAKAGQEFDPKSLMQLGMMLKNLMQSSGMREKLKSDERKRVMQEAHEAAIEEAAGKLDGMADELGLSADLINGIKTDVLGIKQ